MSVLAAAAVIGTGMQIYSQINEAQAQAEAQRREAHLKQLQATELNNREQINEQIMKDKEANQELYTGSDNGTERGSLGDIMRLRVDLNKNIETSRREADWKAKMLNMGAEADMQLASDVQTAGYYKAGGTALTATAKGFDSYSAGKKPSTDTKDLPGVSPI